MYVDADIIFALLKPRDRHALFAQQILDSGEPLYSSVVTLIEVEIVVKRELSDYLSQTILDAVLKKMPKLRIVAMTRKDFAQSLALRQKYGLGIFDSIHAAIALAYDKKIVSTGHVFDRVKGLKRFKPPEK